MSLSVFGKIFGNHNSRLIKKYQKKVTQINQLESTISQLSDTELAEKTVQFKQRLQDGESLENLLVEAFATCREAAKRALDMRHYDVQLIGAMVLHEGKIAEMHTGEGKTLVATLPVYLNALIGNSVHVVTVNDYLAQRDAAWMGKLYQFLGLTVGVTYSQQEIADKHKAYQCDITYGTNNEFGFDYLRDNMAFQHSEQNQKKHYFAIVDEVDSILIDEARTPLIISGSTDDNVHVYPLINTVPKQLKKQIGEINKEGVPSEDYEAGDYIIDEKNRSAHLTEQGHEKVEQILTRKKLLAEGASLYDSKSILLMQYINAAIRAHTLYECNRDYIIEDKQIVIIDEFTGRKMVGRRWSEGLHQAVEAKEGVPIQSENQTLASITFQNYFRLYDKLSGMTGTANTEAVEFQQIYSLEVVVMPTNVPMTRIDQPDVIYLNQQDKFNAILQEVKKVHATEQPILVGTASIETSEVLSNILKKEKIKHQVLNAKHHLREAFIIAQAGQLGAITIATNMAGRGTDIVLGGNVDYLAQQLSDVTPEQLQQLHEQWRTDHQQVIDKGGLYVIATERNESRRVDNQLRGRSGRQGDPGRSRFYLSLEDDLMRIFASDRMRNMMKKLGLSEGESIEHNMVTKAIENAQRKVEGRNYEVRKSLLEYDDVINDQRKLIYTQRNQILVNEDISETIGEMREQALNNSMDNYIFADTSADEWDIKGLENNLSTTFNLSLPIQQWLDSDSRLDETKLRQRVSEHWISNYQEKEQQVGEEILRQFEKMILLQILDHLWKEHLASLDYLRQGIHLRGYAQKNPLQEYKKEAFEMFQTFLLNLRHDVIEILSQVQINSEHAQQAPAEIPEELPSTGQNNQSATNSPAKAQSGRASAAMLAPSEDLDTPPNTVKRQGKKVGRNDPCPCGSGKKYKVCHGRS